MAAHDQPPNRRQGPCVVYAIACGYPDADDLDDLSCDPAFKLACGRLPESGDDLASQPTVSRWENAPDMRTLLRLGYAMIDLWCQGYRRRPKHITLDIDDTVDVVHGHQQLSLFNAHYDERCFLLIMSMTPTVATAWPCCCGLARHHPARRSAATSAC
jgi:Transposase DDE domain group 1